MKFGHIGEGALISGGLRSRVEKRGDRDEVILVHDKAFHVIRILRDVGFFDFVEHVISLIAHRLRFQRKRHVHIRDRTDCIQYFVHREIVQHFSVFRVRFERIFAFVKRNLVVGVHGNRERPRRVRPGSLDPLGIIIRIQSRLPFRERIRAFEHIDQRIFLSARRKRKPRAVCAVARGVLGFRAVESELSRRRVEENLIPRLA